MSNKFFNCKHTENQLNFTHKQNSDNMKTIEIQLYQFEELSQDAKANAISNYRANQWANGDNLSFFSENCTEVLKDMGFTNPNVQCSLSYSQGDGLSFSADSYTGLRDIVIGVIGAHHPKIADFITDNLTVKISGNTGRYCYASKSDIDIYLDVYAACNETPLINDVIEKVQAGLTSVYMEICEQLEKDGYSEIEYEDSDKFISESLISNEYNFTEDGELY